MGAEKESVGAQPGDLAKPGNGRSGRTSYSGRFLVRMPSELHEQISHAAEREEISLNRYVTDALSSSVGTSRSDGGDSRAAPGGSADADEERRSARRLRMAVATNVAVVILAAVAAVVLLVIALQRGI